METKVKNLLDSVQDPTKEKTAEAIGTIYKSMLGLKITTVEDLKKGTDLLYQASLNATGKLQYWEDWKEGVDKLVESLSSMSEAIAAWNTIVKVLEGATNG